MNEALKIFKALSDKTRLRILKILEIKEMCVCEIRTVIGFSMPTISNHLKILSEANLVISEKKDKFVNYKLNANFKSKIYTVIFDLLKEISDETIESDKQKTLKANRFEIC